MTLARETALLPDDTPLWDRHGDAQFDRVFLDLWNNLEQHGRDIDAVRAAHRSDCLARYGEDIFGDGK